MNPRGHPPRVTTALATGASFGVAREIAAIAEEFDGSAPISDQAFVAAARGDRELLLFSETQAPPIGAPHSQEAGGSAPADAVVAIGVIGQGEIDLVVRPTARGRGIGAAALHELLTRDDSRLLAWAHGENPATESLLCATGFTPVRTLYRMELDPKFLPTDGRDPLALPSPPGLRARALDPQQPSDCAAWVDANSAAFASHPEQGRITEADFALMRAEPWFDSADLIVLEEVATGPAGTTRFAGSTWLKTLREPGADGGDNVAESELYALGVRPEHAGQGLGRLLLDITLARMAQHAPDRVSLYVDGENERAVDLYRHAGFTVGSLSRQWARPSASTADARIES